MTDWKFEYEHPPLTDEDWEAGLKSTNRALSIKKANLGMTVDEYKFIYWIGADTHVGRVLSLYFVSPLAYFASPGLHHVSVGKRLSVFFVLGAAQGMIGWWMVKSGLEEQNFPYGVPPSESVSSRDALDWSFHDLYGHALDDFERDKSHVESGCRRQPGR